MYISILENRIEDVCKSFNTDTLSTFQENMFCLQACLDISDGDVERNQQCKINVKIKYSVCLHLNTKARTFLRKVYGIWGIRTNQQLRELYKATDLVADTIETRLERL
jgi:ribosome-associated translation inhibitor RaiA